MTLSKKQWAIITVTLVLLFECFTGMVFGGVCGLISLFGGKSVLANMPVSVIRVYSNIEVLIACIFMVVTILILMSNLMKNIRAKRL